MTERRKEYMRKWRRNNAEHLRDYRNKYYKKVVQEHGRWIYYDKTLIRKTKAWKIGLTDEQILQKRKERKQYNRKREYRKIKLEAISKFGDKCVCCGESNIAFLTIDHVNDDGSEHRKMYGKNIFLWLKYHNYDTNGFQLQIMCLNCNFARRFNHNICPHKNQEP